MNRLLVRSVFLAFLMAATGLAQSPVNLLQNGSFEGATLPATWQIDSKIAGYGSAALSPSNAKAGVSSLKLVPNASNTGLLRSNQVFGVAQGIPVSGLEGKKLYLSSWMQAEGTAYAMLRIFALATDGTATIQVIQQPASASGPVKRRDIIQLPVSPATFAIIVFCQVAGTSGTAYFDDVSLSVGVPSDWKEALGVADTGLPYSATVIVNAGQVFRQIPSTLYGSNIEWIWDGQGLWDPSKNVLNATTLNLAKSAGLTLQRFPGGVFSDYYFWRNGVGPQASRPWTNARPEGPYTANTFGTDEALAFAQQTNGRLLITVNVLTSTADDAAAWVNYVNGASHRVDYWEVGNESYVPGRDSLTPEDYATRFLQFARAMRAVDPTIKVGAIADENFSLIAPRQFGDWTERLVALAGNEIDFLSIHCAYAPALYKDLGWESRTVYSSTLGAPTLMARQLADLSRRLDALTPLRQTPIQLAVTEWGPYFQTDPGSRFVDHGKTLASALFAASTLKTFIESPRTQIANLFKLVDGSFMGWIGLRNGAYTAKAPLLAVQMFRNYFGPNLVATTTTSPTFDAPSIGWVDSAGPVPYLDTVSSKSADSKTLYIMVVNKHFDRDITASVQVQNFSMNGKGSAYTLNGTAADANSGTQLPAFPGVTWATQAVIGPNSRFINGGPTEIGVTGASLSNLKQSFNYTFRAHSVTALVLQSR